MRFVQHNLLSPAPVTTVDVAFVKNVLIYFDAESKAKALGHVDRALSPGGKLVTGPAEGIHQLLQSYRRLQPWLRQKPQRVEASPRDAGRS